MVSSVAEMIEPRMLPMPPSTTNTSTRIDVSNLNFDAATVEKFRP